MSDEPKIDHVGIAVKSLERASRLYRAVLGEAPAGHEEVEGEQVRVAFFGRDGGRVELLEPTSPDSAVGRFLDRNGPGIHHVCLRVDDVEAAVERATSGGADLVPPGIRTGAGGRPVAFLHPGSTGGVLVELTESEA